MIRRFEAIKAQAEQLEQLSKSDDIPSYEDLQIQLKTISGKILEELI